MKKKEPTKAQQAIIEAVRAGGVERRRFVAEGPKTMSFRWVWVAVRTGEPVRESTIRACISAGWVREERGQMRPDAPDLDTLSPWERIVGNYRQPDYLVVNDAGPSA